MYWRRRCRGMRFGRAKHASWRGGLQALVVVVGGGVEKSRGVVVSIFTLYRRRRVKLYTDNGSGRGGLLKWWCLDGVREVAGARSVRAPKQSRDAW